VVYFLQILLVSVLGIVLGSFATALTYRVPRKLPWVFNKGQVSEDDNAEKDKCNKIGAERSRCTSCNERLKAVDLVPVFSWIFLRGKCRYCNAEIGKKYLAIELITLLAALGVYFSFGFSVYMLLLLLAIPFLVSLLFIDLEYMILPDQLVLILACMGGFFVFGQGMIEGEQFLTIMLSAISGAVIFGGISWLLRYFMYIVTKKDCLGFGDIKFFAMAGLWLGVSALPYFMILSGGLGVIFGIIWKFIKGGKMFPFGPAIIVAFYILLVSGDFVASLLS
jgi:prepilin signal peptidase PulO-like enzyme (type II secretory pathway)